MPLNQLVSSRKLWVRSTAVAAAGFGALTLFATPSHAITIPPPGQQVLMVRDYIDGNTILGQHYITPCPGAPLPPDWGQQGGTSKIVGLPCSPAGDPSPSNPYPFPTDGNPTLPGTGF